MTTTKEEEKTLFTLSAPKGKHLQAMGAFEAVPNRVKLANNGKIKVRIIIISVNEHSEQICRKNLNVKFY
jgi:hypothetical protein